MAFTPEEKHSVTETIVQSLRTKFTTYQPKKQAHMLFHTRLLGQDRMALFSFIQSLNTTFGISIYEPVAEMVARGNFATVARAKKSGGKISTGAETIINSIKNNLERATATPSQRMEMEQIRRACRLGETVNINLRRADIYLTDKDNCHYPIDIKTAKPNIDGFEKYKENILKWTASVLYQDPAAQVRAMIAIPYNPYYPEPYKHWTIRGMFEQHTQIKVAEEFWDFLAGKPVYDDILDCFEAAGIQMRSEIDAYFSRFGTH